MKHFLNNIIRFLSGDDVPIDKPEDIDVEKLRAEYKAKIRECVIKPGDSTTITIPLSESDFDMEDYNSMVQRRDRISYKKYRELAEDDYFVYGAERSRLLQRGYELFSARMLPFGLIELCVCIKDRGRGDEDGFGVEPDVFIKGYLNKQGDFISLLGLPDNNPNRQIENWLKMKMNPFDDNGKLKYFPYFEIDRCYNRSSYYRVEDGDCMGLIDKNLNLIIPVEHPFLRVDNNGLVVVRTVEGFYGVLSVENKYVIPPIYTSVEDVDTPVKYKGMYKVALNGKSGIVDKNNSIVVPLF